MESTFRLKFVVAEDFCNYKEPSMFIGTCFCDWKCCRENPSICQNNPLATVEIKTYTNESLCNLYINNDITKAIIIGGLEPLRQYDELRNFMYSFRKKTDDPIVIFTGYTEDEVKKDYPDILKFRNTIVKFGRFIPNQPKHLDDVLKVELASPNQYAKKFNFDT